MRTLKVFLIFITLLLLSSNAYASTKVAFSYVGGTVNAKHLADVNNYWVIVNGEKVGFITSSNEPMTITLKEGDKVTIGVNIKGATGALLGPTYIVGAQTQATGLVATPTITALVLDNLTLQSPLFFKIN